MNNKHFAFEEPFAFTSGSDGYIMGLKLKSHTLSQRNTPLY